MRVRHDAERVGHAAVERQQLSVADSIRAQHPGQRLLLQYEYGLAAYRGRGFAHSGDQNDHRRLPIFTTSLTGNKRYGPPKGSTALPRDFPSTGCSRPTPACGDFLDH